MSYGQNPFIPIRLADILIVDGRANDVIENLNKMGIKVIPTIKCPQVYDQISYHPDIVIHPINPKTLIIAPNVFDYYKEALIGTGINVIKGEKKLGEKYPDNVAYNVARVSNLAVHNFKYTDEKLKYYLTKEGLNLVNVNQGYSKCSISIVSDKAIMTSDMSVYRSLIEFDIDILFIEQGYIELPGLSYGFIGGSTGMLSPNQILFTGSYSHHPDSSKIDKFLKKLSVKPIFITNKKIIDVGSIIPLNCN